MQTVYVKQYTKCDGRCQYATKEQCNCQCKGKYHGYIYRGKRRNTKKRYDVRSMQMVVS